MMSHDVRFKGFRSNSFGLKGKMVENRNAILQMEVIEITSTIPLNAYFFHSFFHSCFIFWIELRENTNLLSPSRDKD